MVRHVPFYMRTPTLNTRGVTLVVSWGMRYKASAWQLSVGFNGLRPDARAVSDDQLLPVEVVCYGSGRCTTVEDFATVTDDVDHEVVVHVNEFVARLHGL